MIDNTEMDKICRGCLTYEQYIEHPNNHNQCEGYMKKHIDCPCQNCLVKSMCDNICETFKKEWVDFL